MGPHLPTRYFCFGFQSTWVGLRFSSQHWKIRVFDISGLWFTIYFVPRYCFKGQSRYWRLLFNLSCLWLSWLYKSSSPLSWNSDIASCSQEATLVPLSLELILQTVIRMILLYLLFALSWCIEIVLPSALCPRALTSIELDGAPYLLTSTEFCWLWRYCY